MKTHNWKDIKNRRMTPEQIARADSWVEEQTVAIRLSELREEEGVTQQELARRVEVAQGHVSRVERGNPHIDTVRRYLEALGYELQCVAVKKDKRVTISL